MNIIKATNEKYDYWVGIEEVISISYFPMEQYIYDGRTFTEPACAKIYFKDGSVSLIYNLLRITFAREEKVK